MSGDGREGMDSMIGGNVDPVPNTHPVVRLQLFDVLSNPTSSVLIHGNRFSGKSTLVRTWAATNHASGSIVAFIDPPTAVLEEDQYWTRVIGVVCSRAGIEPADDPSDAFDALCALLAPLDTPITLILDGIDLSKPTAGRLDELLARNRRLRIIATTRSCGGQALLPNRGDWVTLGSQALAFTAEETSSTLRTYGVTLNPVTAQQITLRTDGLPALVAAVGDTIRSVRAPIDPGSEYLDTIVDLAVDRLLMRIADEDPEIAALYPQILVAAAASPLSASSAAALSSLIDTDTFMQSLTTTGMAECPPPSGEHICRLPGSVREALLRRAAAECPTELEQARQALVRYWLERANPHMALMHALEAESWPVARNIIEQHWTHLYPGGFLRTAGQALLQHASREAKENDKALVAPHHILERAGVSTEPAPAAATCSKATTPFPGNLGHLDSEPFTEVTDGCDAITPAPPPLGHTQVATHPHSYDLRSPSLPVAPAGDATETTRVHCARSAGADTAAGSDVAGEPALAHALRGACLDAQIWLRKERQHTPPRGENRKAVSTAGLVAAALVALDRLDSHTADTALAELDRAEQHDKHRALVLYAHGYHALASAKPADGLRFLDHELQQCPHPGAGIAGSLLTAIHADLNVALGHFNQARTIVERSNHPLTAPARARILLHTNDPSGAEAIVHHYSSDAHCTPRESTELAVIGAAAASALGHRTDARRHLTRAAALSHRTGLLRPFVSLPRAMLRNITSLGVSLPLPRERMMSESVMFPVAEPAVRLTSRERAVLEGLLAGASATSIAETQFVSVNTVKTQLRSLYRKLGVHSREDAIAAARRLPLE